MMIHPASHLRAKTEQRIKQDQTDMDRWVTALAESITKWCEESADDGDMECRLNRADLDAILDNDIPIEKIDSVIRNTTKLLEGNYGYKIMIDDLDIVTRMPSSIKSITVSWSGR